MTAHRHTVLLAAAALAGCSLQHLYSPQTPAPRPTTGADTGDPPPERDGTIPPAARAAQRALAPSAAQPTPHAALAHYATIQVNWDWQNLAAVQRRLASISLGQARAQASQAAAQATANLTMAQERIADAGQTIAIAPGRGAAAGWWVIVTREHTTGRGQYAGLAPTLHITYAQLTHTLDGWVVTRWQPQT